MARKKHIIFGSIIIIAIFFSCSTSKVQLMLTEKQITFSLKNHALDNNDNYSSDDKYLCYDTRGTVYKESLANTQSIEKVEIESGNETILWDPESITGENAAPGLGAVSFHPFENKVVFIHGPFLKEVEERGYYGKPNRTGLEVSADGKGKYSKLDMRDVSTEKLTTLGAHRGGTHRHEYSRDGKHIGFTYDDYLLPQFDRTIGYMEENDNAPEGVTHYFAILIKPTEKGESKAGEIEKASDDSWIDLNGRIRGFIGKVRAEDGINYEYSVFTAEISEDVDITSSFSGSKDSYPQPPKGIVIRRLTHSKWVGGIVRGSYDGKRIAYLAKDDFGIKQIFIIPTDGSDRSGDPSKQPVQATHLPADANQFRWHPSGDWVFSVCKGQIILTCVKSDDNFQLYA